MNIGSKIKLSPKSQKAKNRISQHGNEWIVIEIRKDRILLRSLNQTFTNKKQIQFDLRWVFINNDNDFNIIKNT